MYIYICIYVYIKHYVYTCICNHIYIYKCIHTYVEYPYEVATIIRLLKITDLFCRI